MEADRKPSVSPRGTVCAYYPVQLPSQHDEVRLVDLWRVIVRRKGVFFSVAALVLAAGLAYALLAPPKYRYSALIELGAVPTPQEGEGTIYQSDSVGTALAKINEAFLPQALAEYLQKQQQGTRPPGIKASIPKSSNVLMLDAEGPADEESAVIALQKAVISRLVQEHDVEVRAARRDLEARIGAAQTRLAQMRDAAEQLRAREEGIAEHVATLRQARTEIAGALERAREAQAGILGRPGEDRDAAVVVEAGSQVRDLQQQLLALDERLALSLPKEAVDAQLAIRQNALTAATEQERIAGLEARIKAIRDTRAIQPPTRSPEPVGPGKKVIVALAGMLGVFLGLLAAFGVELVGGIQAEMAGEGAAVDVGAVGDHHSG